MPRATVDILNNAGAPPRVLVTDPHGDFSTQYEFHYETEEVKHFTANIRVHKKGFEDAHRIVEIDPSPTGRGIPITLRPNQPEDPNLLPQVDVVRALGPKLRNLGEADGLSHKYAKDYAHAVQAFLDHGHAEQAVPVLMKVSTFNPECLRCRTMLALAELNWGDWDDAQHELNKAVDAMMTDPKRGFPEPFLVEGEVVSRTQGPARASGYFTEALHYTPNDPFALQEHGRMQCLDQDYIDASISLKKALDAGAGADAQMLYAEALLWTATPAEAEAEFNKFLAGRNPKSMAPPVKLLWRRIQDAKKDRSILMADRARHKARGERPIDYIQHPPEDFKDFTPLSDQAPLPGILANAGKNVAALFSSLPNICSVEKVNQARLTRKGKPDISQEFTYRYLMLTPDHPWGPSIDEYRSDTKGVETPQLGFSQNYMLTSGFVSAPLVFHPAYQPGSTFRLLGMQNVKGRGMYVVAYAQIPAKSRLSGQFQFGNNVRPTYTQGIAWIDSQNFQIVHLISDLLNPLPQVRLEKETTDIEFSEVRFKRQNESFWLPARVSVTLDWNDRMFRNEHSYSDFLVFNVDSSQKIGNPKAAEKTDEEVPNAAAPKNSVANHSNSLVPAPDKP